MRFVVKQQSAHYKGLQLDLRDVAKNGARKGTQAKLNQTCFLISTGGIFGSHLQF